MAQLPKELVELIEFERDENDILKDPNKLVNLYQKITDLFTYLDENFDAGFEVCEECRKLLNTKDLSFAQVFRLHTKAMTSINVLQEWSNKCFSPMKGIGKQIRNFSFGVALLLTPIELRSREFTDAKKLIEDSSHTAWNIEVFGDLEPKDIEPLSKSQIVAGLFTNFLEDIERAVTR